MVTLVKSWISKDRPISAGGKICVFVIPALSV